MTSHAINKEAKNLLQDLIETLQDGHKGMLDLGQKLTSAQERDFLLRESQIRAGFAGEIENELHRMGERDVDQHGSVGGAIHRIWDDLKARLGADDASLLGAAELGESGSILIYEKVLAGELPGNVRDLVRRQLMHLQNALQQLSEMRSRKAA